MYGESLGALKRCSTLIANLIWFSAIEKGDIFPVAKLIQILAH